MASDGGNPIVGIWHPSGSSRAVAATLHIGDEGIVQARDADGVPLAATPGGAIEVSDRIGGIVRRLGFADGSVFETPDNDGVDAALRRLRRRVGRVHEMERFHPRLAVFVLAVVALSFAVYRYAVPVLIEIAIALTPPVVPALLSQSAMVSLDQTLLAPTTMAAERRAAIEGDFAGLAAHAPRGAAGYSLKFRHGGSSIGPNAFALPDGTLVLTDELADLAGDDREALLGVLAHEIGHVEHEHALRRIYRAVGVAGLIMMIGGDIGAGAQDVLVQGAALMSLSYSRDQERDADRYAVELMHAAGRDPLAVARFFELLASRSEGGYAESFLSTHPPTPERIEDTRRHAEEVAAGQ